MNATRVATWRLFALFVASATVTACGKKEKTLYRPLPGTGIVLNVEYMGGKVAACGDPGAWVLRLDTSLTPTGASSDWDRTYLFDSDLELYGCAGTPDGGCADDDAVAWDFASLSRVMLEGLTVEAGSYGGGSADVACRAVADGLLPATPAEIEFEDLGAPTQLPTPGATPLVYPTREWTVRLKVLRVGGSTAIAVPPEHRQVRYLAAASFSNTERGIGLAEETAYGDAGQIAWRGGWDVSTNATLSTNLFDFNPHTLAVTTSPVFFGEGLYGLSATTTSSNGRPGILFAGGLLETGAPSLIGWSYRADRSISRRDLTVSRGFHTTVPFRGATGGPIALVGGFGLGLPTELANIAHERNNWEGYFPVGTSLRPPWVNGAGNCGNVQTPAGSDLFCTPGGFNMSGGAGMMAGVTTSSGEAFFAGGYRAIAGPALAVSDRIRRLTPGSFVEQVNVLMPGRAFAFAAVVRSSGISAFESGVVLAGGEEVSGTVLPGTQLLQPDGTTMALPVLLVPRTRAAGVVLRDRTVLLTGGRSSSQADSVTATVERLVPANPPGSSQWLGLPTAGDVDGCEIEDEACVSLLGARYGHAAVRLEETLRWYDGAVLVIGGTTQAAAPMVELFVPAYECGRGLDPLSNPTLFVPCDRGRAPETITDPRQP